MSDRSQARRLVGNLVQQEAEQLENARARLGSVGRTKLSELGELKAGEFWLLLELLGEALADQVGDERVEVLSSDGGMRVVLEPAPGEASIRTEA